MKCLWGNMVTQTEMRTAEIIVLLKLKLKSPDTDQILAELFHIFHAGGKTLHSASHKLHHSV